MTVPPPSSLRTVATTEQRREPGYSLESERPEPVSSFAPEEPARQPLRVCPSPGRVVRNRREATRGGFQRDQQTGGETAARVARIRRSAAWIQPWAALLNDGGHDPPSPGRRPALCSVTVGRGPERACPPITEPPAPPNVGGLSGGGGASVSMPVPDHWAIPVFSQELCRSSQLIVCPSPPVPSSQHPSPGPAVLCATVAQG